MCTLFLSRNQQVIGLLKLAFSKVIVAGSSKLKNTAAAALDHL
jgi:hypothetical protein